ncbi:hypothetical protein PG987_014988 [Apiospora arundinis]
MDNGYCLYIECRSTTRVLDTGDENPSVVPVSQDAYDVPTNQQRARLFFLESPWAQGEHFKNHNWITWLGGPEFGHTSRPDPSNKLIYCRLLPVQESLIKQGLIAQPEKGDIEREVCKFNISLNPTEYMTRTKAWKVNDNREQPTAEELVSLRLAHFPKVPGLVTKAPIVLSGVALSKPANTQLCSFERTMAVPEIREGILKPLMARWQALSNLARTSQTMFMSIELLYSHWDLTNQWFGGRDLTIKDYDERKYRGAWTKEQKAQAKLILKTIELERQKKEKKGAHVELFDPIKIVSVHPVRSRQVFGSKTLAGDKIPDTEWFDHSDSFPDPMSEDPIFKGESHISLLRSIYRHGEHIQVLNLHRTPFLNVDTVKAFVQAMPNLQTLGIYSCDLLNISHTKDLLNIVIDANRANTARPLIEFDYYPRFYRGPVENRVGSYGVFWNDEGGINTAKAVAAGLLSILRVAKQGKIELVTAGKAFLKWLNDFPWEFCTLPSILVSIARILAYEDQYESMLGGAYQERPGDLRQLLLDNVAPDTITLQRTLHNDLYVAVMGTPLPKWHIDQMEFFKCSECGEKLYASFFKANQAIRAPGNRMCHGCDLLALLQNPYHNFSEFKRIIAAVPWMRRNGKVDNLRALFRGEHLERPNDQNWKTNLIKACRFLRDEAPASIEDQAALAEQRLAGLVEEKSNATNQWQHRNYDKEIAEVCELRHHHRTVLGEQLPPANKPSEANDWDDLRRKYCLDLGVQTGRITNQGPHMALGWQSWM